MPSRMAKYRYISILVSICIFILSSYLLAIPIKYYITNHIDEMVNEQITIFTSHWKYTL